MKLTECAVVGVCLFVAASCSPRRRLAVGARRPSHTAPPGQQEAGDVAEVVPGVRQEGQGIGYDSVGRLDGDKAQVQDNADRKGSIKAGRRMRVRMPVRALMAVTSVLVGMIMIGHVDVPFVLRRCKSSST